MSLFISIDRSGFKPKCILVEDKLKASFVGGSSNRLSFGAEKFTEIDAAFTAIKNSKELK